MDSGRGSQGFSTTGMSRLLTVAYIGFAVASMAARAAGILDHGVALLGLFALTSATALYLGDSVWRDGDRATGAVGYALSALSITGFMWLMVQM